jgi:hypothetical protein
MSNAVLDDGYICEHCGKKVGLFEPHDCVMKHLHEQLQAKKKRKKPRQR